MRLEKILDGLEVQVEPFAICKIAAGKSMAAPPFDSATFHYVLGGSGTLSLAGNRRHPLGRGSMFILPAATPHRLQCGSADADPYLNTAKQCDALALGYKDLDISEGAAGVVLACTEIRSSFRHLHGLFDYLPAPIVLDLPPDAHLATTLDAMLEEMASPGPGTAAMVGLMMKQCLIYVLRDSCQDGICDVSWLAALDDDRFARAIELMVEEPGRKCTLEMLSSEANMSRATFARRFKKAFNRPAMDFLRELRLEKAAHLLSTTERPIKRIAGEVGFESRTYFSKLFAQRFGVSPAEFRDDPR